MPRYLSASEDEKRCEVYAVGNDEDDDDGDEESRGEYERDTFIVDEGEDNNPDGDEECKPKGPKTKRRKRDKAQDFVLDEDDYVLLEEANATGFRRPPKPGSNRVFKRLKKTGSRGNEGNRAPYFNEGSGLGGWQSAEEQLQLELFGDFAGPPEDILEEDANQFEDAEVGEEDEMADFIVDVDEDKADKRHSERGLKTSQARGFKSPFHISGESKEQVSTLEQQFEPSLLAERYMMEKDDIIRETDVPERMQYLEAIVGPFPRPCEDKSAEAAWIYERVFGTMFGQVQPHLEHISRLDKEVVVQQIMDVLKLMHENRLEVPFIALYRQEYCPDLVRDAVEDKDCWNDKHGDDKSKLQRFEALWAVQLWDKRWLLLKHRKLTLRTAYQRRLQCEALSDTQKQALLGKLLVALDEAHSELGVDDVDAQFHLHFPADEVKAEQGQFKRPKRCSFYRICRQAGLGNVSKYFGLSSEQFGENLKDKRHKQQDTLLFPEQVAAELAGSSGSEFCEPASVLKGARHMAAVEIFCEPTCREYVRNVFNDQCTVSTKPTLEGNAAIGSFHKYGPVKWLINKPVSAFDDDQWLLIQKAEEEQVLTVTIGLPEEVVKNIVMQDFGSCYISDGVSKVSKAWNEQRWQILKEVFFSQFVPFMEKEMRMVLSARAKHFVAMECGSELRKKVAVAPYVSAKRQTDGHVAAEGDPVLACCWGPGNPPTTFVMLDMFGEVIDKIETAHMTLRSQTASIEQQRKKAANHKAVLDCVKDHNPNALVVGAAKLCCRNLMEDIVSEIISKLRPREEAEVIDHVFGDETIPSLYENSRASEAQLPGQPGIVRRAVALGRYLQNPLAMVASLFGPRKEILSLRLHPLQECLTNDELYEALEEVMVTVTNQVGVDINMATFHEWLFAPVQFVCGLGPRKAAYIQRCLRGQRLNSRNELMTAYNLMGRYVFTNAAGFIRIQGIGLVASASEDVDILDETRIHPELYTFAQKVAEYAYREECGTYIDEKELTLETAVAGVKQNPSLLRNLDTETFLSTVRNKGDGGSRRKQETVNLIISELLHSYSELRAPYTKPSEEDIFDMLTGENEGSLAVGKIIHATVRKVQQYRVLCTLECGISAVIQRRELSDEKCDDPSKKVHEGNVITCRIKDINKAKFFIDLTCKGSQLRHEQKHAPFPNVDPYYHENPSLLNSQQEKVEVKKDDGNSKCFNARMIVHSYFRNMSRAAAIEALKEKDIGEVIIRPSTRGPSHLSMTLKFYDEMYIHIDISEDEKETINLASFLRLGKKLQIGDKTFEDLDEIIARYVNPLVSQWREMYRHRKFRRGTESKIDDTLRKDKSISPKKTCFCFSVASDHPGVFRLCYIQNANIRREYISVSPDGFKYRKRNFDALDKLIAYFAEHRYERMPKQHEGRLVASMRLHRDPAPARLSYDEQSSGTGGMPSILGRYPGHFPSHGRNHVGLREASLWPSRPRNVIDSARTQAPSDRRKSAQTSSADECSWGRQRDCTYSRWGHEPASEVVGAKGTGVTKQPQMGTIEKQGAE